MGIDRRAFIASAAAVATTGLLPALRPRVYAASPAGVGDRDLASLRKALTGRLVASSDADYDVVRKVRNRAFDGVKPRAVVLAESAADVQAAVQWAAAEGVPIVPRCGGHSYIGQSTTEGLVVSLVPMSDVTVDKRAMVADVAAGAMLVDVNVGLLEKDVALPTGSCPSVGVAGLTLGGGIGFSSRKWGLMCDNLVGVTMVLASGQVVHADEKSHPELLWACRGGGGGHFGVVTSFRFRVHPVEPISRYSVRWPWKSADKVLSAWQEWAPQAPDELFSVCVMTRGKKEPAIRSHGRFFGTARKLRKLLAPLLAAAEPSKRPSISDSTLWKGHVTGPKCWPDPTKCHSWNHPQPGRYKQASYMVKSDYFKEPLNEAARDTLIRWVSKVQDQRITWGGVILDALGGAINNVPKDATAFMHRDSVIQAEYVAHWKPKIGAEKIASNQRWMRELYAAMRPFASGECYQNYPDLDLDDWETAYFGENLARLHACKTKVDPGGLFRGKQILAPGQRGD